MHDDIPRAPSLSPTTCSLYLGTDARLHATDGPGRFPIHHVDSRRAPAEVVREALDAAGLIVADTAKRTEPASERLARVYPDGLTAPEVRTAALIARRGPLPGEHAAAAPELGRYVLPEALDFAAGRFEEANAAFFARGADAALDPDHAPVVRVLQLVDDRDPQWLRDAAAVLDSAAEAGDTERVEATAGRLEDLVEAARACASRRGARR